MKLLVAAAVIGGCALTGFFKAADLKDRPRQLRILQLSLNVLATEIGYLATPLPQALRAAGQASRGPVSVLWFRAAEAVGKATGQPFSVLWDEAVRESGSYLALAPDDWQELQAIGAFLGRSGREDQMAQLKVMSGKLAALEREAVERKDRLARLYQYMGWAVGLSLSLFLI